MVATLILALAAAQVDGPESPGDLPAYPCVAVGTNGDHYETMSAEWSWSPNGESIVYDRAVGGVSQLRFRDLGSARETCITSGEQHDSQPTWSHDGQHIGFVRATGENAGIWVLELATGIARPLIAIDAVTEYPRFSPGGTRLAYVRHVDDDGRRRHLVARDLASGEERVLFDSPFGLNNLSWTPNGMAVAFYSIAADGWNDIYEATADGSDVRRITDNTVTDSYSPAYSAEGRRLLFGQGSEVSPFHRWFNYDLYERDLGTGSVRRLTWTHQPDDRGQWSPDGETIGFVTRRSGYAEIWLMNADGTELRPVTGQPPPELTGVIRRDGVPTAEAYSARVRASNPSARLMSDRAAAVLVHQYLARGDIEGAVRIARMGVAMHPESWWTHTALGRALLLAGEPDSGRAALRESLRVNPNQFQIAFDLGFTEFIRTLDSIDGVYREKSFDIYELSHRLHIRGELLSAITLLRRLDEANPNDAAVIGRLAYMQMTLGDYASAIANYQRVLELDPSREDARFHLRRIGGLATAG